MEDPQIVNKKETLSFFDFLLIILKRKKIILWGSFTITVISIILFFFVFDLIYFSTASIKSSGKNMSSLIGVSGLTDIGGISDLVGGGGSTSKELAYYMEVLSSRRCLEPLIIKFNLMQRDDIDYMDDAIKIFRKDKLVLDYDKISGILTIGVYDKDKILAKEMVEFLIDELNKINIELSVLNAKNNREFIEQRYIKSKEDLSMAEDSLKTFQMMYGVAPDLQIKAAAQSVFALEAELKAEEVKLDVLKKILSPEQPEVKTQEVKINSIRSKISEIQNSTTSGTFLSLGNSPIIALSYLRLQREIEIQTKIMTFVLPLYEQAKIEEKKETPTVLILDKPTIADRKSKPKRLTMVVITAFMSLFLISISLVLYDLYIRKFILVLNSKK